MASAVVEASDGKCFQKNIPSALDGHAHDPAAATALCDEVGEACAGLVMGLPWVAMGDFNVEPDQLSHLWASGSIFLMITLGFFRLPGPCHCLSPVWWCVANRDYVQYTTLSVKAAFSRRTLQPCVALDVLPCEEVNSLLEAAWDNNVFEELLQFESMSAAWTYLSTCRMPLQVGTSLLYNPRNLCTRPATTTGESVLVRHLRLRCVQRRLHHTCRCL